MTTQGCIGIFDPGVGGLPLLQQCFVEFPGSRFIYFRDAEMFPYANHTPAEVAAAVRRSVVTLANEGASVVVATSDGAAAIVRAGIRSSDFVIPLLFLAEIQARGAAEAFPRGTIGVLASPFAVGLDYFDELLATVRFEGDIVLRSSGFLEPIVEHALERSAATIDAVRSAARLFRAVSLDTLVLSCSHAFLVADLVQRFSAQKQVYDGLGRTIEAIRRINAVEPAQEEPSAYPDITLLYSGNVMGYPEYATRYLQLPMDAIRVTRAPLS